MSVFPVIEHGDAVRDQLQHRISLLDRKAISLLQLVFWSYRHALTCAA